MRRTYLFPSFVLFLIFCTCIFFVGQLGIFHPIESGIQQMFFPISALFFKHTSEKSVTSQLEKQNIQLTQELKEMDSLKEDNKALQDQFQTLSPSSRTLLPVTVVGMPGVIPNITFPETLIVNAGSTEGVGVNMAVVVTDNLIGFVTKTTDHFSEVTLVSSKASSFSVKTATTGAIGVLKGQGNGQMLLDNVLLSDKLVVNDFVVTAGSQNLSGNGLPPNLIIGKISSIEKNPSSLFQQADVLSLLPFDRLSTVFIITH